MSSKTETKTTNTYNKASMANYNSFQGSVKSGLDDYANNPNKLIGLWQQQQNKQIGALGDRMNSNVYANRNTGGWGGGNLQAFQQAQINRNSRAVSGMQSNAFMNNQYQADDRRRWALGQMQSYQPLQTGGTQTQTKSGVGTWLPQIAGAAIGGASSFFSGGATSAFSGGFTGPASSTFGLGNTNTAGNALWNNPNAFAPPPSGGGGWLG